MFKVFNKYLKHDDAHEFKPILAEIEDAPVSPLGRTTFWLVLGTFAFIIVWMCFGKVDVVITGRGQVIPDGQVKVIQPLNPGVISSIYVKPGDLVKKDQVLVEIDPSTTEPEMAAMEKNLDYANLEINRIQATLSDQPFRPDSASQYERALLDTQQSAYAANRDSLQAQVSAKQQAYASIQEQVQSAHVQIGQTQSLLAMNQEKKLRLDKVLDIIAKDEYERVAENIINYQNKIQELNHQIGDLQHRASQTLQEIAAIQQQFRTTHLDELSTRQKQAIDLEAKLTQSQFMNLKQKIASPVSGYVNEVKIHTVGGVVTPAEELMTIVPDDVPLMIKAVVLNKDIGFVEEGMPVNIKVDTYEFQKYGILEGKVAQVSRDSRLDEKLGPVYDVYVTPINQHMVVEGREVSISPGMSVSAEIKVGKRRIVEFFIYPMIKYWNEGISVR